MNIRIDKQHLGSAVKDHGKCTAYIPVIEKYKGLLEAWEVERSHSHDPNLTLCLHPTPPGIFSSHHLMAGECNWEL